MFKAPMAPAHTARLLALGLVIAVLSWAPFVWAQDGDTPEPTPDAEETPDGDPTPEDGPEAMPVDPEGTKNASLKDIFWVDRTSSIVAAGAAAVAVAPDDPNTVFVAGRGFVARSIDRGVNWEPVLLLIGSEFSTEGETATERVESDDVELFDDSEAVQTYNQEREELLDQLTEEYGEDFALSVVRDVEDELREEAFAELLDAARQTATDERFEDRLSRLRSAGFEGEEALELAADPMEIRELFIPVDAPHSIYAATGLGLYRSLDRGDTWERIYQGSAAGNSVVLDVVSTGQNKNVMAGTAAGLVFSDDGGRTWTGATGQIGLEPVGIVAEASSRGRFYALAANALHRTDDSGLTWSRLIPSQFQAANVRHMYSPAGWSDTLIVVTTQRLYRSDDGGETFLALPQAGLGSVLRFAISPTDHPDVIVVAGSREIYTTTTAGLPWDNESAGLLGQQLNALAIGSNGDLWLASETGLTLGLTGADAVFEAETIRALQEVWDAEPNPSQVIWAALFYNGVDEVPTETWHTQQLLGRLAPLVDVRVQIDQQRWDEEWINHAIAPGEEPIVNNIDRQQRDAQYYTDVDFRVMAIWDLGEILFDSVEPSIEAAGLQINRERTRLAQRVVKIMMQRRALQVRMARERNVDLAKTVKHRLELEELTALLDGLTGNYFTATTAANKRLQTSIDPLEAFAERPVQTPGDPQ